MAQRQFTNYQDDILSFDLREAMLGILKPGRYCGFDTVSFLSYGVDTINITMSQATSGVRKATKANPPILGTICGVALTPQGIVIHEDNAAIPITLTDGNAGGGVRYDIIYLEHIYLDGTPGDNPATYGVTQGTPGAGVPTLDTTKRIPLIRVTIPSGSTTFEALVFTVYQAPEIGDLDIGPDLLALVGNRQYSENNFITDGESLTDSLNILDIEVKDNADDIITIGNRAIDSADWGNLTDITEGNVSTLAHGLTPKLPNDVTKYLNGLGNWVTPSGSSINLITSGYFTTYDEDILGYVFESVTEGDFDLSTIVPVGTTSVLLDVHIFGKFASVTESSSYSLTLSNPGSTNTQYVQMDGRLLYNVATLNWDFPQRGQYLVPVDANRKIHWSFFSENGADHLGIRVLGYVKPA